MIEFNISHQFSGIGISKGLDRGLLVYEDGKLLVEEGMGIGACAVKTGGFTYFSSIYDLSSDKCLFETVRGFDKRLELKIAGIRSKLLTWVIESITANIYMKYKRTQNSLLRIGEFLRRIFNVDIIFSNVPSIGELRTVYKICGNDIVVDISGQIRKKKYKLFVMNELGGNIFDMGIIDGRTVEPPFGWQKMDNCPELYSSLQSLAFTICEDDIPDKFSSRLYWGREMAHDICWAGFESEITCESEIFDHYKYRIRFRKVMQ
jgi:hypothetical protein